MSNDQDDRDTLPPSPPTSPPSPIESDTRISAAVRFPGYDESNFMHRATAAVIDGTNALLAAKQTYDIEAILQRQRVLFEGVIGPKLDTIAGRVTNTETGLAELRAEFQQLKSRMTELERRIGKEASSVPAEATSSR